MNLFLNTHHLLYITVLQYVLVENYHGLSTLRIKSQNFQSQQGFKKDNNRHYSLNLIEDSIHALKQNLSTN